MMNTDKDKMTEEEFIEKFILNEEGIKEANINHFIADAGILGTIEACESNGGELSERLLEVSCQSGAFGAVAAMIGMMGMKSKPICKAMCLKMLVLFALEDHDDGLIDLHKELDNMGSRIVKKRAGK